MRNLSKEFEHRNIEYDLLSKYGFVLKEDQYILEKKILNNTFKVVICISENNQNSQVIDLETGFSYVLVDINEASGSFVGKVKEEYENVLADVILHCTSSNVFKNKQTKEIIQYIKDKYHDELEYLWPKTPNNAIWRNSENLKWYGVVLQISERKLGLDSDKIVDILDLRYQKGRVSDIVDHCHFFEGYHMNKKSWITIRLDGSVPIEKICFLIDNSYNLSLSK